MGGIRAGNDESYHIHSYNECSDLISDTTQLSYTTHMMRELNCHVYDERTQLSYTDVYDERNVVIVKHNCHILDVTNRRCGDEGHVDTILRITTYT